MHLRAVERGILALWSAVRHLDSVDPVLAHLRRLAGDVLEILEVDGEVAARKVQRHVLVAHRGVIDVVRNVAPNHYAGNASADIQVSGNAVIGHGIVADIEGACLHDRKQRVLRALHAGIFGSGRNILIARTGDDYLRWFDGQLKIVPCVCGGVEERSDDPVLHRRVARDRFDVEVPAAIEPHDLPEVHPPAEIESSPSLGRDRLPFRRAHFGSASFEVEDHLFDPERIGKAAGFICGSECAHSQG